MKLSSFIVVTFGIGVISYPAIKLPVGSVYFADDGKKQAEPVPKSDKPRTDFAINEKVTGNESNDYKIVVNIPATKLTLYENGVPVMEFPVAVGQAIFKTPRGHHELKKIEWNPWWYPPKADWAKNDKITPPGPRNPLGPVKMPISNDLRFHGTSKDWSIGRAASHGCMRMHSNDAVTLAWYLQTHLTDQNDTTLLEKYKKYGSRTFGVTLKKPVEVELVYKAVAFNGESLEVYPDLYGFVRDIKDMAMWEVYSNGVDPWGFDFSGIKKPQGGKEQISLKDLTKKYL